MSAASPAVMSPSTPVKTGLRWKWPLVWLAVLVACLLVPRFVTSAYYLGVMINIMILGIAAVGIGFLMHQCGFVMFGVAAFIGLPAYLVGIATNNGLGLHAAVLAALVGSTVFAALVGALVVRTRPLPFSMLTLALAQMLKSAATLQSMRPITNGDDGMSMNFNGGFMGLSQSALAKNDAFWPVAVIALALVLLIAWKAATSRFGQVLRATQANEERMRFSGFDTYLPRLLAFTLACFLVSISGVMIALHSAFASPELLDFATGGHALIAMLIGGAANVLGPLLGAALYTVAQDYFGSTGYLELLTGIAIVVMIWVFPKGAMGLVLALWNRITRGGKA